MNYRESIKTTIHTLREFDPGEEIITILEDLANDERENFGDRKPRSIEDKLKDLRNRYDSDFQRRHFMKQWQKWLLGSLVFHETEISKQNQTSKSL